MKKANVMCLLVMCVSAMMGGTSYASLVENFESYSTDAQLVAAFNYVTPNVSLTLETTDGHLGTKAAKYSFNNGADPYYSNASLMLPGPYQDWSSQNTLSLWYKVTAGGTENLLVGVVDYWGTTSYFTKTTPPVGDWTKWDIDLTTIPIATRYYINRLYLVTTAGAYGGGTILFDDITVTPEPATLVLLGLGGLLLRKRK